MSEQDSPMGTIPHRDQSASPPTQAQQPSKRDKRRQMIADKLAQMVSKFASNRDTYYREHLQALQIDMHLLMEADTHTDVPLVSDPAGVDAMVRECMKKIKGMGSEPPTGAGRIYADFANNINNNIEQRDANLAMHKRDFEIKMQQAASDHAYRLKIAAAEHRALSGTLRDRLINSVTNKKTRLSKDRETVEIGESNALLLHPSQFGIANPTSPGGLHGKRASRHRRDAEEHPSITESNKRKRKAGDSDESPAPTRQRIDNGSSTPLWFAEKNAMTAKQIDSPLYSIEKLFTEKELSMTYNTAALAAHSHMQRHPPFEDLDSPPNGKSDSNSENVDGDVDEEDDLLQGGVMMERQYSHATRSTRGAVNGNYVTGLGIDALSDINHPGNLQALTRQIPRLPPFLQYGAMKVYAKGEAGNSPAGLVQEDISAELEMIRRARNYNDERGLGSNLDLENGGKGLLEMASNPRGFAYWVQSDNKSSLPGRREVETEEELTAPGGVGGLGVGVGVEMERGESRVSNTSDMMGGSPMSRQATGDGVTSSKSRKITRRDAN